MYAEPTSWTGEEEPDDTLSENLSAVEPNQDLDLIATISAFEAALDDASALQANAEDLTVRMTKMKDDLHAASAQLTASENARAADQAQIAQLEQQLAQRTELGESLKSQLAGLSETLESFS